MTNEPTSQAGSSQPQPQRTRWTTWILLGLGGFFLFLTLLLSLLKGPPPNWLPAHIHSMLSADYSQDPRGTPIAQVRFSLIHDLLSDSASRDKPSSGLNPDERFAIVINEMLTPVPTVTPMPGSTVFVPTVLPSTTATPPSTDVGTSMATLTQRPSSTPTVTASLTPSLTPTIFPGQGTSTGQAPTQGPSATRTSGPPATRTSGPGPTGTASPAATNTPQPTQPPATATPQPTQRPTATSAPPTNPPYPHPPTPYP